MKRSTTDAGFAVAATVVLLAYGITAYQMGYGEATKQLTAVETTGVTLTTCVSSLERALDFMLVEDEGYHEYEATTAQWRALIDAGGSQ